MRLQINIHSPIRFIKSFQKGWYTRQYKIFHYKKYVFDKNIRNVNYFSTRTNREKLSMETVRGCFSRVALQYAFMSVW